MARPRAFNETEALQKAKEAFWDLGYDAVTIEVLERRMGISRSSVYATFGNKDSLYVRAMDQYVEELRDRVKRELQVSGPALRVLRSFFSRTARRGEPGCDPLRCCMIVRACVTGGSHDPAVRMRIHRAMKELDGLFYDFLTRARSEGALKTNASLSAPARFLTTIYQALNIAAHAGRSRNELNDIVRPALTMLS